MSDPRQDEVAQLAWGVLVAAQQDGVTDPSVIAHAIASNVLRRLRTIERESSLPRRQPIPTDSSEETR